MFIKENIIEYLQSHDFGVGFQELCDLVIKKGNCAFCGLCASICPRIGIKDNIPTLLENDPECSTCFKYCTETYFPKDLVNQEIFTGHLKDSILGHYQKVTVAKSRDGNTLKVAQNGGVVTSLLIHALDKGIIDGVLLTDMDENWVPIPKVATTAEEILSAAGNRYTMSPSLLAYADAVYKYKLKNLAFVGMPCQIRAARKLQLFPPLSEDYGKIKLIIGLFCSSNFSYDLMKTFVQNNLKVPLNDIKKIDISRGKFLVYTKDGSVKSCSVRETEKYKWPSCYHCKDYSAEFADISVGSVGAPSDDKSSVIIRSDAGMKLFDDAIAARKIFAEDTLDLVKIEREANRKKMQITKLDDKIISAVKFLNVSEKEMNLYSTIISLGFADIEMLSKILKIEEIDVKETLHSLIDRGWVEEDDRVYNSVNPNHIISQEINQLKKKLEENIKNLKSESLSKLGDLFIKNNLRNVLYREFDDIY